MINTVNKSIELLLKLDPQAKSLLARIDGKSLTVNMTDIHTSITLTAKDRNLIASNDESENVLSGTSSKILELVFNKNLQEQLIDKTLDYQGSLSDIKQFYSFFGAIHIDIIYQISKATSPRVANLIEKPFNKTKDFIKTSRKETILDIKEYLTEEKRVLISKNEMNIFFRNVQKLREDLDRIEAKINLLQGSDDD